ncbi:MAG: MogA/MoaB family molybdenum cofactor biosynthesis protein, partial [Oceanidesulfovibrio sp.]
MTSPTAFSAEFEQTSVSVDLAESLAIGEVVFLARAQCAGPWLHALLPREGLPVGLRLAPRSAPDDAVLMTVRTSWLPAVDLAPNVHAVPGVFAKVLRAVPAGRLDLVARKTGWSMAWITLSDSCAAGQKEDTSGPVIEDLLREKLPVGFAEGFLLPDDETRLRALVVDLALNQRFDIIVTTGGTGLAPTDRTPEALAPILEKRLPGMEQAMIASSLAKTPHGALTRSVAGALGRAIVISLPGSP